MKRFSKFLWILFYLAFILEAIYNIKVFPFSGLSAKNIVIYLLILVAAFRLKRGTTPLFDDGKVFVSTLAFVGWCLFSLLIAFLTKSTNLIDEIIFFKSYMDPYVLMIISYHVLEDEDDARFLLFSLMAFMVLSNLLTILASSGVIQITRVTVDETYGRTRGAFGEPNNYAAYIILFLPRFIGTLTQAKSCGKKAWALIGVFMGILCLMFTGSRGGLVGLAAGVFALLLLSCSGRTTVPVLKVVVAYIAVAIFSFGVFKLLPQVTQQGIAYNIMERAEKQSIDEYSSGRLYVWTVCLKLFSENPLLGIGWNTFSKRVGYNTHSDYLLFLVTTGLPGFFLFCNLYYRIWVSVLMHLKSDSSHVNAYIYYLSGFLAFTASMAFVNIYNPSYFFFLYTAAILKMGALSKKGRNPSVAL